MGLMHRSRLVLLAALVIVLAAAGAASASRAPTPSEGAAIRVAVEHFVEQPGAPAQGSTVRRIRVSTVSSRYAMAKLRTPAAPLLATAVLERRGARWRVVTFGVAGFPFKGVPEPVLNDLLGATLCDCY
jgi:hypothetical protein